MRAASFVHLHLRSEYTLSDGLIRIAAAFERAAALGMPALALTDHGNLFGAVEFYRRGLARGVKPILGLELEVATGSERVPAPGPGREGTAPLVLLARSMDGYRNLVALASAAHLETDASPPYVGIDRLAGQAEGLHALSGGRAGPLARCLAAGDSAGAERIASRLREIFGERFHVELHDHGLPEEIAVLPQLVALAGRLHLPLVATNDVRYLRAEDAEAHDVRSAIGANLGLDDPDRARLTGNQHYLKSGAEMSERFAALPDAVAAAGQIATDCNVALPLGGLHLPRFELPAGAGTESGLLAERARNGLSGRFGGTPSDVARQRLETELEAIARLGYSGYFLIVAEIVAWTRAQGIPVGPGRGSAAGSLVAYALGITEVDPLRYDLLFERFLNPERVSPPDIDVDFCVEGRPRVLAHIAERYGRDRVAQITTFGTLHAKAAIRDVGRVLRLPAKDVDRIAKLVPAGPDVTLAQAFETVPELAAEARNDPGVQRLLDLARGVEGVVRHASTHAAGIVVADRPLVEQVPLYRGSEGGGLTTQYDMHALEAMGLLKMDILGLRTLTVLGDVERRVAAAHGGSAAPAELALDDAPTYDLLASGHTLGVFQLDSAGMRDLARQLQPRRLEDIVVLISLFRPGASRMIQMFIDRRRDASRVTYAHPGLEPILRETHGVILYQEQVMRIASDLAGFPMSQADLLRRAMGKKDPELMERQRESFVSGAASRGLSTSIAERIFSQMAEFAGYGFNKSHGVAYALVAYRTAFHKANHPRAFMAALLTSEIGNPSKLVEYAAECSRMAIELLGPDVNRSDSRFEAEGEGIRWGLLAIKHVGGNAVQALVAERSARGPFASLTALLARLDARTWSARMLECLVKAGALDSLGVHRRAAAEAIAHWGDRREGTAAGQGQLFGGAPATPDAPVASEWEEPLLLAYEKEVLGLYLSGHPLARVAHRVEAFGTHTTAEASGAPDGARVVVCGMVRSVRKRTGRELGTRFYSFVVEDLHGMLDATAFEESTRALPAPLADESTVIARGRMATDARGGRRSLRVSELLPLEGAGEAWARSVHVTVPSEGGADGTLRAVHELALEHPGPCPLQIHVRVAQGGEVVVAPRNVPGVALDDGFLMGIRRRLGPAAVKITHREDTVASGLDSGSGPER